METLITTAERVLSEAWGNPVRLSAAERQSGTMNRSRVLRCPVLEAGGAQHRGRSPGGVLRPPSSSCRTPPRSGGCTRPPWAGRRSSSAAAPRWERAVRQRQLLRLDTFAATTEQFGHLEAIGATARKMAVRLRSLWPPEAEMPLYPPFRAG